MNIRYMNGAWSLIATVILATQLHAIDSAKLKPLFANPPREYSTGPLWTWNDMLTEQQIRETLRDMAAQKVKQVWVHPRPGLMTQYLSPDWFRLWKVALDEAKRLDMNVWIYDENSYPSGFAGGFVPELMPESRGVGVSINQQSTPIKWSSDTLGVYKIDGDKCEALKAGTELPAGKYVVATLLHAANSPWHGGRFYVDLMHPGVTEKFLDVTMEAYRREVGKEFGKRIPGVFTDEPNLITTGGSPWSENLAAEFQKRWHYSLIETLPSLSMPVGDWKKVRHDYLQVLSEQFIEHWAKPYYNYCEKHNLDWTGHYWEHEWPHCQRVPDNMAMYSWQQRPAIDCLMNQYHDDANAQFGNARAVRELSSVANQIGLKRTLCESYGAGGWDLRFEDMKRIGDWLSVLGVNTINQHLSYVTIRGARKRDHPQSFSYHAPWWNEYHASADYFSRVSAALSQGEQVNSVLLLEPTTTAWMYNIGPATQAHLNELGAAFQKTVLGFESAQVEYDIGSEYIIEQHGSVKNGKLVVGKRDYRVVVVPEYTENLNSATIDLLEKFLAAGGTVLCSGETPTRIDGATSKRAEALAKHAGWKRMEVAQVISSLSAHPLDGFSIARAANDKGILFHQRRQIEDGEILFLVNSSIESSSSGTIEANVRGVEQLNLETGKTSSYFYEIANGGIRTEFHLPPSGSLLLLLSRKSSKVPSAILPKPEIVVAPDTRPEIRRLEPNVLTIDYCDVTAGGQTKTNIYCYSAGEFAFQKNGMEHNPWDHAVQFKDELVSRKFPADSGFAVNYRFTLEQSVPANLAIVIERPDLYTITCNGQSVTATAGDWWLDKSFAKIGLGSLAHVGENVVTIKTSPFTIYNEIEPAYLLGDFALRSSAKGFVVVPPQPLQLGKWNEQGHPLYSAGVSYSEKFEVPSRDGQFVVSLGSWLGSVAKVRVNGKDAGVIGWPPWQCDVTKQIRRGENTIEVVVIGTLKNTLGPHHGKPPLGAAWPTSFRVSPKQGQPAGDQYSTVGYGLFEPFVLKRTQAITTAKREGGGK